MINFMRYIVSDFQKTKRLKLRAAHILIPICVDVIFLSYYRYCAWDSITQVSGYFQILNMGFPFLTGLFCAILAEQEFSAGALFNMLSVPKRYLAILSKLSLLILFGGFSVFLASFLFAAGYYADCKDYIFYAEAALLLWAGSIPLYVWHLFLSLRFPRGVSLIMGITESLLAALMMTSLGDMIWKYIPCAWSARWITQLIETHFI